MARAKRQGALSSEAPAASPAEVEATNAAAAIADEAASVARPAPLASRFPEGATRWAPITCWRCGGRGTATSDVLDAIPCRTCKGRGALKVDLDALEVLVPVRVREVKHGDV